MPTILYILIAALLLLCFSYVARTRRLTRNIRPSPGHSDKHHGGLLHYLRG